ncbi:MAG: hypothetical protein IPN70_04620 [Candidatus Moraniibacteriota bacterium]|nr:MAG: hypothetical protein IPN70_04620 [Candidatus Moranbacteria bacterium]
MKLAYVNPKLKSQEKANKYYLLVFYSIFCLIGFIFPNENIWAEDSWENYEDYQVIDKNTVWKESFVQENVLKPIVIVNGAIVTIEPGTKVEVGKLIVYNGRISARGSFAEPIIFTKMPTPWENFSKEYDKECNYLSLPEGTIEFQESVSTEEDTPSVFEYVIFEEMGRFLENMEPHCFDSQDPFVGDLTFPPVMFKDPAFRFSLGQVEIKNASFRNNFVADVQVNMEISEEDPSFDYLHIKDTDFYGNAREVAISSSLLYEDENLDFSQRILLQNNWYGSFNGPTCSENSEGDGKKLEGKYELDGWKEFDAGLEKRCPDCLSNILFLPGLKASRLYTKNEDSQENRRWLPTVGSDDWEQLLLDKNGKSESSIYTKDVLDSVVTGNIYESFLDRLSKWKSDGDITDYKAFAYDWRMNVEDIVKEGVFYPNEVTRFLVEDCITLANSSKTGKVTIIAHSNGGLLAKALLLELQKQGREDLAETVVFVASPQMGTPLSILSLLYGYDEPIPGMMTQEEARALAENMPGAYGLLPTREYFDAVKDPFIHFNSDHTRYKTFKNIFGKDIETYDEFTDFLLGTSDKRKDPDAEKIDEENVLSQTLFKQAKETAYRLANWKPGENIRIVQLAGWGLDTVSGISYNEEEKGRCYALSGAVPSCVGIGEYNPLYEPVFSFDGDGIVTDPSALMLGQSDDRERYWVNLFEYDDENIINRRHRDILETDAVQEFLEHIIEKKNEEDLPEFITQKRPEFKDGTTSSLRITLHSPLDLHIYDSEGRHTGLETLRVDSQDVQVIQESIPNTSYFQFGERKYIHIPKSKQPIRVELFGYKEGYYTLSLEEIEHSAKGEKSVEKIVYSLVPTSSSTKAFLEIPSSGVSSDIILRNDYDGDDPGQENILYPKKEENVSSPILSSRKDETSIQDEDQTSTKNSRKSTSISSIKIASSPLEKQQRLFEKISSNQNEVNYKNQEMIPTYSEEISQSTIPFSWYRFMIFCCFLGMGIFVIKIFFFRPLEIKT